MNRRLFFDALFGGLVLSLLFASLINTPAGKILAGDERPGKKATFYVR